jgi:radical SAM protein with 4Fe4S-binding SPASM domain
MHENLIKPLNTLVTGYSYLFSSLSGRAFNPGMPASISVELTNHCNLNCPECLSGSGQMKRGKGFMNIDLYDKVLKELSPYLYNINLYFQGEPMMHPQFFLFLEKDLNTYTIVSTNGHFLSEENSEKLAKSRLKKLIVSLDGIDQTIYSEYRRNGKASTVIRGIMNMSETIKRFHTSLKLEIQFLVNRYNEAQIPLVRHFAEDMNASLSLKSMQILRKEKIDYWQPSEEKFRRYKNENGEYVIKSSLPNRCMRLWFNPVITWEGKVVPCCFDKNADWVMGDINQDSFRDIWYGEKYKIFRNNILKGRHIIGICNNCTSGIKGVRY